MTVMQCCTVWLYSTLYTYVLNDSMGLKVKVPFKQAKLIQNEIMLSTVPFPNMG